MKSKKTPKRRVHWDMDTNTRPHGNRKAPLLDAETDIAEQLEWYYEEEERKEYKRNDD